MGLNRMMMKGSTSKDIEAKLVIGYNDSWLGYMSVYNVGEIEPNPLPNGVRVSSCAISESNVLLEPNSIKTCTLVELGVDIKNGEAPEPYVISYLASQGGYQVPVIFHFE